MQHTLFDWSEAQEATSSQNLINGQVSKPAHVVEISADQLPLFDGHIDAHTEEISRPDADTHEWEFRIESSLPRKQLLKWIGNKQRFAHEIVSYFPQQYGTYFEPFLGSGALICDIPIPEGLFENEALVNCGRSMLKRFQMDGKTLEEEVVADRLLLTY